MNLDQSSIISICSAMAVITTTIAVTRVNMINMKETFRDFKLDIKEEICKEKAHAMELAGQRIRNIEKDVDEMFPRVRSAEDNSHKNCYAIKAIQRNCVKHHKEVGG